MKHEVVGILNLDDQVQVTACQSDSADNRVVQLNVRLPEVVSQSGATHSRKGEAYPSYGDHSNIGLRSWEKGPPSSRRWDGSAGKDSALCHTSPASSSGLGSVSCPRFNRAHHSRRSAIFFSWPKAPGM